MKEKIPPDMFESLNDSHGSVKKIREDRVNIITGNPAYNVAIIMNNTRQLRLKKKFEGIMESSALKNGSMEKAFYITRVRPARPHVYVRKNSNVITSSRGRSFPGSIY